MNNDYFEKELVSTYRYIRYFFGARVGNASSPLPCRKGTSRLLLPRLWKKLGYRRGAEIGVWRASYSKHILRKIPSVLLYCIDPWSVYPGSRITAETQDRNYVKAIQRLGKYRDLGRAVILRDFSEQASRRFADNALDFVFIDAHHSFDHCVLDLVKWVPKVRKGGMVAVHDYCVAKRSGVLEAVNSYTKSHKIHPWYVTPEVIPTAFWVKHE